MDTLLLMKAGFVLVWSLFAAASLWYARRADADERRRRAPRRTGGTSARLSR